MPNQLKLPTSHLMRELYTQCSVIPPSITVGTKIYPVNFNLDKVVADSIHVAGNMENVPGAVENYIKQLSASSLYILTNDMQVQITKAIFTFITEIWKILKTHNLIQPGMPFNYFYLCKSEITFDIFIGRHV